MPEDAIHARDSMLRDRLANDELAKAALQVLYRWHAFKDWSWGTKAVLALDIAQALRSSGAVH